MTKNPENDAKPTGGVPAGTQLNGIYEIDELIAIGGMGEVYRGHNIQTDDVVAIKIVLPEFCQGRNNSGAVSQRGVHSKPPLQ